MILQPLFICYVTLIIRWTFSICAHANHHKWGQRSDSLHLWSFACAQTLKVHRTITVTWHINSAYTIIPVPCHLPHPTNSQYLFARPWSYVTKVTGSSSPMIIGVRKNTESSSYDLSDMTYEQRLYNHSCTMSPWSSDELSVSVRASMIIGDKSHRLLLTYDRSRALIYRAFIDDQRHMTHEQRLYNHSGTMLSWPSDELSVFLRAPMITSDDSHRFLLTYDHWSAHSYWAFIRWWKSHDTGMIVHLRLICHVTLRIRWTLSICAHNNDHKRGGSGDSPH